LLKVCLVEPYTVLQMQQLPRFDMPVPTAPLCVIIAACNEARYIGPCLQALLKQDAAAGLVQIVVAANACTDDTVALATGFRAQTAARGWELTILDLPEPGKVKALNSGEAAAKGDLRAYLDADVICEPALLGQIRAALDRPAPTYATGTLQVARAQTWTTQRYSDVWTRLPFVTGGAVGAGFFALNGPGRARWGSFPAIISDDTFVRLNFTPAERVEVPARYHWPMVEGLDNLIRVRRRQNAGVAELARLYPHLMPNEGKARLGKGGVSRLAVTIPVSFAVYMLVHVMVRVRSSGVEWTRGR
jgi:glycosyltransferase involved in cell wall biosynthesis